jgi:hypothetical protein
MGQKNSLVCSGPSEKNLIVDSRQAGILGTNNLDCGLCGVVREGYHC